MDARRPLNVLFLCTGNSARSILGEALLRDLAPQRFTTASAGSHPTGQVHPKALQVLLEDFRIDASAARSKSLEDLGDATFDLVFTVCDNAKESCPLWPQDTTVVPWGLPDPATVVGTEEDVLTAFRTTARELRRRLKELCSLPVEELDREQLERHARRIAERSQVKAPSGSTL